MQCVGILGGIIRCGPCSYLWGINEMLVVREYLRCRVCRYMWGIYDKWAV